MKFRFVCPPLSFFLSVCVSVSVCVIREINSLSKTIMNNLHTHLLIKKSTTQNFNNVFIINLSIVFKCNVLTELLLTKTFTKKRESLWIRTKGIFKSGTFKVSLLPNSTKKFYPSKVLDSFLPKYVSNFIPIVTFWK